MFQEFQSFKIIEQFRVFETLKLCNLETYKQRPAPDDPRGSDFQSPVFRHD
jgi:hypothetical protein